MLYHTHIFQCSNITSPPPKQLTLTEKQAVQPTDNSIDMFLFLKGHTLSWPLPLWVHVKKKTTTHGVVVWLGFETALCQWCNGQGSAQWFHDKTSVREVRFRSWFWSPAVFFPLNTGRKCVENCYSYFLLPTTPHFRASLLSTWTLLWDWQFFSF